MSFIEAIAPHTAANTYDNEKAAPNTRLKSRSRWKPRLDWRVNDEHTIMLWLPHLTQGPTGSRWCTWLWTQLLLIFYVHCMTDYTCLQRKLDSSSHTTHVNGKMMTGTRRSKGVACSMYGSLQDNGCPKIWETIHKRSIPYFVSPYLLNFDPMAKLPLLIYCTVNK